ncbi:hypothetical protein [Flavicella marina]|uniref:hypothetical protein n=1 Tax=Flavicella marina TaxID=1475951 RepID=UPI001265449D|nr:hypothetical protein [Flavicella marina]
MRSLKLPFNYVQVILIFSIFLVSCSSASEEAIIDEGCNKKCRSQYELNEETCSCEEIVVVCTKVCETGYTLNENTCECEEDAPPFVPTVITVETETATLVEDWKLKTDISDYSGNGYIVWEGPAQFWKGAANIGKAGKLTYKVNITVPGTYLFQWKSYIAKVDPNGPTSEHNDSWLKFPDADNFYGISYKDGSVVYPAGSGKSPIPKGESGNGFFKIYMNTGGAWSWISSTSDNDAHRVFGTFSEAKEYTIEIAARSNYHAIDSFKLTLQKPE